MNEQLTSRQLTCLLTLSMLGGISFIGGANEAGRDTWLALLLGGLAYCPLLLCYLKLMEGQDSIEGAFRQAAGQRMGRLLCLLYGLIALYLAAVTLSIFAFFVTETSLAATPRAVLALLMALTAAFAVRSSLPALGRFGQMLAPAAAAFLLVSLFTALPQCDFRALLPAASRPQWLAQGAWSSLTLSFAESFFPLMALGTGMRDRRRRARGAFGAAALGGLTLCAVFVKNLAALDYHAMSSYYFPSFAVGSLSFLGAFFQRFEAFVAVNFLVCQLCKAALCLLFAQRALAPLLRLEEPRRLSGPLALAAANFGLLFFSSEMALFAWLALQKYLLTLPLLILPPLLLILRRVAARPRGRTAELRALGDSFPLGDGANGPGRGMD